MKEKTPRSTAINNKKRGKNLERKVVKLYQERGWIAQRAWGSDGRALGLSPGVDVEASLRYFQHVIQCKKKKKLAGYLKPAECVDMVITEEDRGTMFAIVPLRKLLDWIKLLENIIQEGHREQTSKTTC